MNFFLILSFGTNIVLGFFVYLRFYKKKYLFSERFGSTLATTASMQTSLVLSLNAYLLFPGDLHITGGLSLIAAVLIGIAFGTLVNFQTLIAGIFNGGVGGIMGTMLGAVAFDPTLCGLPANFFTETKMIVFFAFLSLILHSISSALLTISLRV